MKGKLGSSKKGITLTSLGGKKDQNGGNSGFVVKGKRYDSGPRQRRNQWGNKLPPKRPKKALGNKENDKSSLNRFKKSIFSPKKNVQIIKVNPLQGEFKRLRQI